MKKLEHKTRRREEPQIRKQEILNAAIELAKRVGYQAITRDEVAQEADASSSLITCYFYNMDGLKRAVMQAAIELEELSIIAQGLGLRDAEALAINDKLKSKAINYLISESH